MVTISVWVDDDDTDTKTAVTLELTVQTDEGASVEAVAEEISAIMLKWLTTWTRYSGAKLSFKRG